MHENQEIARHIHELRWPETDARDRATKALLAIGAPAVPDLIETLSGTSFLARIRAAKILGEIGDARAAGPLTETLRRTGFQDKDTGWAVADALARLAEQNPVPELRHALLFLESNLTHFGGAAARLHAALAPLPEVISPTPEQEVRRLIESLPSPFNHRRDRVVRELIELDAPAVTPLIGTLRWSPLPAAREVAAEALCVIGDARAVEPLLAALKDEMDATTRATIARRLQGMAGKKDIAADARFTRPLIAALTAEAGDVRRLASEMLAAAGPPAAPALVAALGDVNGHRRRAAALILGRIAAPDAAEGLRAACADEYPLVRSAAVAALGCLGQVCVADIAVLIQAIDDDSTWVRRHAAEALAALADRAPVPDLRAALPTLRRRARFLFASDELRDACHSAIEKIEAATEVIKDLPLPTIAAPPSSVEGLPLPAAAPPSRPDTGLPIPAVAAPELSAPRRRRFAAWWQRLRRVFRGDDEKRPAS